MENVIIDFIKDEGDLRNGWFIKTLIKLFVVYVVIVIEKLEWMNYINKCVIDLFFKSGKIFSNEYVVVWVFDFEVIVCMRC